MNEMEVAIKAARKQMAQHWSLFIKLKLMEYDVTQAQFAALAGIGISTLSSWLDGLVVPSMEKVADVCARLDVSPHLAIPLDCWAAWLVAPEMTAVVERDLVFIGHESKGFRLRVWDGKRYRKAGLFATREEAKAAGQAVLARRGRQ